MARNTPCLPQPPPLNPQINLYENWFQFLLGITVAPREVEDSVYAEFGA